MNIVLVTPAPAGSRAGNRATASRWAGMLRALGHRVRVTTDYDGSSADLMIALHAWRSAQAVAAFRRAWPANPLVVVLTGTDIYRFQHSHPEPTLASMMQADVLVGLHDCVAEDIPAALRGRLMTVLQSARPLVRRAPLARAFEACVVGHLREEKDSLRAAFAVRDLPADSRLRVVQLGGAHTPDWAAAAEAEMATNPRYVWRGEVAHGAVRRLLARARLMVMSSRMEGGANVVSEACVAGLPVIASDIAGNRGLLGEDYPGYYPVGDTEALRKRLLRAEAEPDYVSELAGHCIERARHLLPACEQAALAAVVARAVCGRGAIQPRGGRAMSSGTTQRSKSSALR